MEITLSKEEIRVMGCLIEKGMATPEYYPLSMNALVNACNQKSNREPVVLWDEGLVYESVEMLKEKGLVSQSDLSRVPKYEENFTKNNNLNPPEAAVLCVLMLRGPQTVGEIRGRSERLYAFDNLEAVNETLEDLISRIQVLRMQRQPGRKEVRYCHALGSVTEEIKAESTEQQNQTSGNTEEGDRIVALEEKVDALTLEMNALKLMFEEFKRQFE